jgi:hypothetical protein
MSVPRAKIIGRAVGLLIALAALIGAGPLAAEENFLHQSVRITMLVADPELSADRIEQWVEEQGGYLLFKSGERVSLRLPHDSLPMLRGYLEGLSEDILEYSPQAVDLRERYFATESGLRSRQEILTKNQSLLDKADVAGTLAIEQEMIALIQEVESLQATLQRLAVDRVYAWADISLQYLSSSLPDDLPSSFAWINRVSFYDFIREGL